MNKQYKRLGERESIALCVPNNSYSQEYIWRHRQDFIIRTKDYPLEQFSSLEEFEAFVTTSFIGRKLNQLIRWMKCGM